jgi:hypothetical protein
MIKAQRDLNVLNLEHLTNMRTRFCIDHSKMNVIPIDEEFKEEETHLYGCQDHITPESIEKFVLEEKNKMIYRKRFRFDLGEPDYGPELPEGFLGGKEKEIKDPEVEFYVKSGD